MQKEPHPSLLQLLGSPEPRRFGEPSPPHHSPVLPPPRLLGHSTRKETRVLKGLMFREVDWGKPSGCIHILDLLARLCHVPRGRGR